MNGPITTYKIAWGHSGVRGRHWTTAREAARYAADEWGEIQATSPEDAVAQFEREGECAVADWWHDGCGGLHVVFNDDDA